MESYFDNVTFWVSVTGLPHLPFDLSRTVYAFLSPDGGYSAFTVRSDAVAVT